MKSLIVCALTFWAALGSFILAKMHGQHFANLQKVDSLTIKSKDRKQWGIYHIFDTRCSCSVSIIESLTKRKAINNNQFIERIFYYGQLDKNLTLLKNLGYKLHPIDLKQLGVTGVPLLVVFGPQKKIQYAGGYANKVINPFDIPNEKKLITQIIEGKIKIKNSHPVIGCAISKEYQKILDPLGLKYDSEYN
jgi:hypothetical protein